MVEVHSLANFEVVGEYEILFSGQAKIHRKHKENEVSEDSRDNYVIPCLLPAKHLELALNWLGTVKSKKGNTYRIDSEDVRINRQAVNSRYSKELNGSINLFYNNEKLTYHGLRDIYASVCQQLFGFSNQSSNIFLSKILGHSVTDTVTANTYQKFVVMDWEEITKDLSMKPKDLITRNSWNRV
jgi:hypothetical protein